MSKPIIHGVLVDAAAALVLCQHDSPLIFRYERMDAEASFGVETDLAAAREAASAYLVACFNHAAQAAHDEAIPE